MTAIMVYVTAKDAAEASEIAHALVDARLVACANLHNNVTSVYRWDGAVQEDNEAVLILKTRSELAAAVTDKIISLHSYDCPCVVTLPIDGGNPAFIEWVVSETRDLV